MSRSSPSISAAQSDVDRLLRRLRKQSEFWILPYVEWTTSDGSKVISDRKYRPIWRISSDARRWIVPPETFIPNRMSERHLHDGFGLSLGDDTRAIVAPLIGHPRIMRELSRRLIELRKTGSLPECPPDLKWGAT